MEDKVNHPKHYTQHPSGVECITITEHMNFNVGNAIKYLWRAGLKDTTPLLIDLKKAQWYITREIQRIEAGNQAKAGSAKLPKLNSDQFYVAPPGKPVFEPIAQRGPMDEHITSDGFKTTYRMRDKDEKQ